MKCCNMKHFYFQLHSQVIFQDTSFGFPLFHFLYFFQHPMTTYFTVIIIVNVIFFLQYIWKFLAILEFPKTVGICLLRMCDAILAA